MRIFLPYGKNAGFVRFISGRQSPPSFSFLAASSIYLSTIGKDATPDLLQQYIPTAETRTLILPDGTEVQLNSQSTLLYPQEFTGKDRSVFLLGEANFKVKPDKNTRLSSNPTTFKLQH